MCCTSSASPRCRHRHKNQECSRWEHGDQMRAVTQSGRRSTLGLERPARLGAGSSASVHEAIVPSNASPGWRRVCGRPVRRPVTLVVRRTTDSTRWANGSGSKTRPISQRRRSGRPALTSAAIIFFMLEKLFLILSLVPGLTPGKDATWSCKRTRYVVPLPNAIRCSVIIATCPAR
jgi:hypothetical protein